MKLTVIAVGKVKEKFYRAAVDEYVKRLSRYCTLESIEVADEKAPESLSDKEIELVKGREGEKILSKIKDSQFVITLEIGGKSLTSEKFADYLGNLALTGQSDVVFVIGGSLGLCESVVKRSNFALSFSKMTFPHQLMKVILLEQVYRAFRIMKNEPYHK
ncbi:23S rRNA (pseudouridine(1915)-N(3))-methyltransferase RlmH [Fusibacter tunisiensis]|uniref:Ribosomal RNA large subunit methyltransferase H n=1 Tax=Fusibacter tunisiensis TaxID=1008308 RepID=A0ABS2MU01_9FIRM|nr:23S rRNA (pseudouridine(1915)-N(3))-methyltransferase RlmH [Fusibacter tunisiensis]MBM7562857.1 23S rRNA (pseudouridine1915-N3)-methyltransferase [Fusibacter tunisiensis]